MTPEYVAVKAEWTVREVLDHVRIHHRDSETLNVPYVVDGRNVLIDDLRIREILLSPPDANVRDIKDDRFLALRAPDEKALSVEDLRKYDRTVLPVVGPAGTLLGIATIDDVLDVAEELSTTELQRFGGQKSLDESYVNTPFLSLVRKRASWLVVLFRGEMLTSTAMGHFEKEIEKALVLALFVPLIISSGGNSGSQAATPIIRAQTLGEVRLRDYWSVMRREIHSGLMLGTLLGSIGFVRIAAWSAFSLVATLVEVIGLVIYFSEAMVVLRGTLLRRTASRRGDEVVPCRPSPCNGTGTGESRWPSASGQEKWAAWRVADARGG